MTTEILVTIALRGHGPFCGVFFRIQQLQETFLLHLSLYLSALMSPCAPSAPATPRSAFTNDIEAFPNMSINNSERAHVLLTSNCLPLTGSNNIEIGRIAELHRVSFLAQYGDYAGCLFDKPRSIALTRGMQLPRTVTVFQVALSKESMEDGGRNTKMLASCAIAARGRV